MAMETCGKVKGLQTTADTKWRDEATQDNTPANQSSVSSNQAFLPSFKVQSVTQEEPEEETDEYAFSPHCPHFTQLSIPNQEMALPTIMMTIPMLIN